MRKRLFKIVCATFMVVMGTASLVLAVPHPITKTENVEEKPTTNMPMMIKDEDVVWTVDSEKNRPKATYPNGEPLTGWHDLTYNGKKSRFCFDENGVVKTEWYQEGVNKFFFDNEGRMVTGTVNIDGEKYLFDNEGRCTGIFDYARELNEFLLKNSSYVVSQDIQGGPFYIKSLTSTDRVLYRNKWFESFATGEKGWYATDDEAKLLTGFVEYNGNIYYLSEREKDIGKMVKNMTLEKNGRNYLFDEEGRFVGDKASIKEEIYHL